MTEGNVTMSAGDLVKRRFSGPLRARLATDLLSEHGGLLAALAVLIVAFANFCAPFRLHREHSRYPAPDGLHRDHRAGHDACHHRRRD